MSDIFDNPILCKNCNSRMKQTTLEKNGFLMMPKGVAKGYFGQVTKQALIAYQKSVGINATGNFGPLTMAKLNSLTGDDSATKPKTEKTAIAFNRNLKLGLSGDDVKALQTKLKELGYYTYPEITGYFGKITKEAVMAYQKTMGITPVSGLFGPLTREKLGQ